MQKKVTELEGAELDLWVAKSLGHSNVGYKDGVCYSCDPITDWWGPRRFSSCWDDGGPIIEHERIRTVFDYENDYWECGCSDNDEWFETGRTLLIAAMRCFVASNFGEVIDENN